MAHIKEPIGIDLIVKPMVLTIQDRQSISATIAAYKNTGEMPSTPKIETYSSKKDLKSLSIRQKSKQLTPVL